jgi:hypothetical protein
MSDKDLMKMKKFNNLPEIPYNLNCITSIKNKGTYTWKVQCIYFYIFYILNKPFILASQFPYVRFLYPFVSFPDTIFYAGSCLAVINSGKNNFQPRSN